MILQRLKARLSQMDFSQSAISDTCDLFEHLEMARDFAHRRDAELLEELLEAPNSTTIGSRWGKTSLCLIQSEHETNRGQVS